MDLLTRIINCKTDKEADDIITEEIEKHQSSASPIEQLGFLPYNKCANLYKGFIPLKTRIKYSNMNIETYSMESTDFFYEFVHFLRKYNINEKNNMVFNMKYFLDLYFGLPGNGDREQIFYEKNWNSKSTDEEFFAALKNNKIGDLKGKGAAECTEYGALAQQLLNLFGIETYYCIGQVSWGEHQGDHCFNIAKAREGYCLLDYAIPVEQFSKDGNFIKYIPFMKTMTEEEFLEFIKKGEIKTFRDYKYINGECQELDSSRKYVVGSYSIDTDIKL